MLLRNWVVLALLIGFGLPARAGECPVGFDAMERLELLPVFLPSGTQTKQFITYDPDGKNRSGFFKRYEENGEYVFFDEIGPGFLCRQQMNVFFLAYTKFPNEEIRIRYYFDDEAKPRIDMTFAEFFGKGGNYKAPFTPPLAYFDEPRKGTYAILYYPFAFNKRLKITAYHAAGMKHYDAAWFQYTYLKYPPGTPVETWKGMEVDSPAVRTQFERTGEDPKKPIDGTVHKTTLALAPGETKTALDLSGQGAITALRLKLEPWSKDAFFHTRLRITWDDQQTPAVDMPISSFFGGGGDTIGTEDVSGKTLATLFFGFDAKTGRCYTYWPMPYWSRAQVEIVNESRTAISRLEVEAVSASPQALGYRAGESGYFCARRTIDISPDKAPFSQAFKTRGRGKVVGLTMYSVGYNTDGDEFTYIDGSRTPQIHGDGTEDDHNQGWGGYAIQKPYWGGLVNGFQGAYRLYIVEPYIFDSSIDIRYEHSNCGGGPDHGQKTDFVVWYYLDKPGECNLKLTDELDVGKPDSEKAHAYRATGEKWLGVTSSSYDRMEQDARVATTTDDGRAFAGTSEFTVKIDPANDGVKLRRRVNRNRSNVQRTDVYVDGRLIVDTPWYVCDLAATPETAFRDSDYEIPAVYTKGKDRLTIKLQHVAGQADDSSNEYYYWVYSYGRTALQPEAQARVFGK
ncbi:MAG: DUF2961 domain-containing protein [Phycisphaerae bacterium]